MSRRRQFCWVGKVTIACLKLEVVNVDALGCSDESKVDLKSRRQQQLLEEN